MSSDKQDIQSEAPEAEKPSQGHQTDETRVSDQSSDPDSDNLAKKATPVIISLGAGKRREATIAASNGCSKETCIDRLSVKISDSNETLHQDENTNSCSSNSDSQDSANHQTCNETTNGDSASEETNVVNGSDDSQNDSDGSVAKDATVEADGNRGGDESDVLNNGDGPLQRAKCNVDEMIRRLDEIDPVHKLRSLCKKGDTAELSEFLKGTVDLNVVSDEGWTCLHEIITHECQFTEVARILLSHGAKVNTQDLHGDSPLHSSLLYHCTENIQLLLNHGADVELTNTSGRKPIHVANDEESIRMLLEHGAHVNAPDQTGNTCLHYAVVAKDKDRVKLLLSSKSDVNVKNGSGSTPLHLASDPEIAAMLLDACADPNDVDLAGNSPLHLAVRGRHKEVVRNLIDKKANPNLTNKSGKNPTSFAKDKEMKNILAGKLVPPQSQNGVGSPGSTPITRKRPLSPFVSVAENPNPNPAKESPSILKKRRRMSNENGERTSRLRFSDVNEYSFVDQVTENLDRRVKVRPIYSEPQFSSDED